MTTVSRNIYQYIANKNNQEKSDTYRMRRILSLVALSLILLSMIMTLVSYNRLNREIESLHEEIRLQEVYIKHIHGYPTN